MEIIETIEQHRSKERRQSYYNVKYLSMHKVQMHAGAINKLLYSFASVRAIIAKACGLSSRTYGQIKNDQS